MKKEIGGYFEIEESHGREYHEGLTDLNLGRTALTHLLNNLNCGRIYIPYYMCDSVLKGAEAAGVQIVQYHLNDKLEPQIKKSDLCETDYVYITNFYGQLTVQEVRGYKDAYTNIIVDNAQAFFEKPVDDIPTIYSCRKFLGVSDGAYLSPLVSSDGLETDKSMNRFANLLGRMEESASEHYHEMLAVNATFDKMKPMRMSRLTHNILRGIDYEYVAEKRDENYRILRELLPSENPFTARLPVAPFAYPYYHRDGLNLRKALAAKGIYVQTNWKYLLDTFPPDAAEHIWSADILPLPVDQRYGRDEMKFMADCIKAYED